MGAPFYSLLGSELWLYVVSVLETSLNRGVLLTCGLVCQPEDPLPFPAMVGGCVLVCTWPGRIHDSNHGVLPEVQNKGTEEPVVAMLKALAPAGWALECAPARMIYLNFRISITLFFLVSYLKLIKTLKIIVKQNIAGYRQ